MQLIIVCTLRILAEDNSAVRPQCFLHLHKCVQHLTSFPYAANMNEIINGTKNYATGQQIVVSVWTHEQPQTEKKIN